MNRLHLSAALALGALLVGACKTAAPVDPLAEDRARLLALAGDALEPGWSPHAAVVVGPGIVEKTLGAALAGVADEAAENLKLELPLGATLSVQPKVSLTDVVFSAGKHDDRVKLTARLQGTLSPRVEGILRIPLQPFELGADVEATLGARLEQKEKEKPDDPEVLLLVLDVEPPGIRVKDLEVLDLPPELRGPLAETITSELERALQLNAAGFVVSELGNDPNFAVRGLRVRPARTRGGKKVARLELAFATLEAGTPMALPDPGEGFVVVIPPRTLFGLARAAALKNGPIDGKYSFEPTEVSVKGNELTLSIRVWEISPQPRSREYAVFSELVLEAGELKLNPTRAEERGLGALAIDPISLIVRGQVLAAMQDALKLGAPVSHEQALSEGQAAKVEIARFDVDEDGQLRLFGEVDVLAVAVKKKPVSSKAKAKARQRDKEKERAKAKAKSRINSRR